MTDKEKIITKIERIIEQLKEERSKIPSPTPESIITSLEVSLSMSSDRLSLGARIAALEEILVFINSLPAEQSTEQLCWNDMTEEEKSDFFTGLRKHYDSYDEDLDIEQSSKELAEAAQNHARKMYGENWMELEQTKDSGFKAISNFKFGAQWQKEKLIKKAYLWLQHNAEKYAASYGFPCYQTGLLLHDFKHAMEENEIIEKGGTPQ